MGGGTTLRAVSGGLVPYWLGGAIVSLVVMAYVFFGGMRGTAWVNTFQTVLFLSFGAIAVAVIATGMGGFRQAIEGMLASPSHGSAADPRARVAAVLLQLHLHSALVDRVSAHRHLLPDGEDDSPTSARRSCSIRSACSRSGCRRCSSAWSPTAHERSGDHGQARSARDAGRRRGRRCRRPRATSCASAPNGDDVILRLVEGYAPLWLAVAAGRGGDGRGHGQRLADPGAVHDVHRGCVRVLWRRRRFGEAVQVQTGRLFVDRADRRRLRRSRLDAPQSIFDMATQYAFAGYSALSPLLVAALFWKAAPSGARWPPRCGLLWRYWPWLCFSRRLPRPLPARPLSSGPREASTFFPERREERPSSD